MDIAINSLSEPQLIRQCPWSLRGSELLLSVRLTPNGSCDAIDGTARLADGRSVLKVRVRAVPEHGKANEALLRMLAKILGIPASAVRLERGAAGRIKFLCLRGDLKTLVGRLEHLYGAVQ